MSRASSRDSCRGPEEEVEENDRRETQEDHQAGGGGGGSGGGPGGGQENDRRRRRRTRRRSEEDEGLRGLPCRGVMRDAPLRQRRPRQEEEGVFASAVSLVKERNVEFSDGYVFHSVHNNPILFFLVDNSKLFCSVRQ